LTPRCSPDQRPFCIHRDDLVGSDDGREHVAECLGRARSSHRFHTHHSANGSGDRKRPRRSAIRAGRLTQRSTSAMVVLRLLRAFAFVDRESESAQSNGVCCLRVRDWDNVDAYPTLMISAGSTRICGPPRAEGSRKFRSFLVGPGDQSHLISRSLVTEPCSEGSFRSGAGISEAAAPAMVGRRSRPDRQPQGCRRRARDGGGVPAT
jgi:hypothetical protein